MSTNGKAANDPPFNHLAILGVGLLGGSIGLAARRAGFAGRIYGLGHRRSSLDQAVAAGAIDAGFLDAASAVADADLVILAGPISTFQDHFAAVRKFLADGAIVTDVGSTKKQVMSWAAKLLPRTVHFVGSHPIAGSDKRGVQYARADLFDGACCVITPSRVPASRESSRTRPYEWTLSRLERFWQSLGMWTVRMTPAAHDRCLAEVSHLPHAAAAALMLLPSASALELAGSGFVDATRIAGGDPHLWRDIFLTNSAQTVRAIRAMSGKLARLARLIETGNNKGLVRFLAAAQQRRAALMTRRLNRGQLKE